ncbi:hypothetical protein BDV30DRAFT_234960 [Aspergillus minisclerotigenes]|uniref:Uncharacterized protein n=1 Tax=Aspergillus minisclerotigenes TaxID=656917 RepID=A0A5N6JFS1_9EURO|nr:hypothetical protein BDV30DRAFT_234960 [Aspergillus minisclerotigenes]
MTFQQHLRDSYVVKDVGDVPKPALVLDAAIIQRHCEAMVRTVKELAAEIAEMQVDDKSLEGNFIASTILEIETLVPLLKKLREEGYD